MMNLREVVQVGIHESKARKIGRDSDGNCYRITYRDGAEDAAIEAASRQISSTARIHAIQTVLEQYEERVLEGAELQTS